MSVPRRATSAVSSRSDIETPLLTTRQLARLRQQGGEISPSCCFFARGPSGRRRPRPVRRRRGLRHRPGPGAGQPASGAGYGHPHAERQPPLPNPHPTPHDKIPGEFHFRAKTVSLQSLTSKHNERLSHAPIFTSRVRRASTREKSATCTTSMTNTLSWW